MEVLNCQSDGTFDVLAAIELDQLSMLAVRLRDALGTRAQLAFEDIARVYAETPAQQYGLWPAKGRIGVGADADLVLVDPAARRTLRNEDVHSKAGWTPFDGREVQGTVVQTYLRGTLIAENAEPTGARSGRFVSGAGTTDQGAAKV